MKDREWKVSYQWLGGGIQMDLGNIRSVVSNVILYVMGKQNGMQQMWNKL